MRPGRGGGPIARWLLPAAAAHAAVGWLALRRAPHTEPPRTRPAQAEVVVPAGATIELTLLADDAYAPEREARLATSAQREPARGPVLGASTSTSTSASTSTLGHRATLPRRDIASVTPSSAEPTTSDPSASGASSASPAESEAAASLSLDQLGIGANPFTSAPLAPLPEPAPLSPAESANQRLQAALHQQWFDSDRQRGLGPEGPIVGAARRLLVADEDLSETSAVLNVRVDAGGRVTEVHVLEASSQGRQWQMIAARLANELGPMSLRRPVPNPGWSVKLRLASALKLPSGLTPGLRTDIFGLTLPGSASAGAASLSLKPTSPLPMPEPIDRIGRQVEKVMPVELGLLKLRADVADIGGSAQRVVQVVVLSVDDAAAL